MFWIAFFIARNLLLENDNLACIVLIHCSVIINLESKIFKTKQKLNITSLISQSIMIMNSNQLGQFKTAIASAVMLKARISVTLTLTVLPFSSSILPGKNVRRLVLVRPIT